MQHHDALANEKAIERSSYARLALRSEFEEAISERTRMRKPQVRAVLREKLNNPCIVRENICGPRFDLCKNFRMKVFDGVRHDARFAYLRTRVKR